MLHKIILFLLLTLSINVYGQYQLAALSPTDVKTIELIKRVRAKEHVDPLKPDSIIIDLRNFTMPTQSTMITSKYGPRWGRTHKGLDIKVYTGDTIVSAFKGKVIIAGYDNNGYGKYIVIRHRNGLETVYGHLSKLLVHVDQEVESGEPIGLGGNTGRSTGPHLHFETRVRSMAIDPALLFDFRNQRVTGMFFLWTRTVRIEKGQA